LHAGFAAENAELAVARTGTQVHPVFCLCQRRLHADLHEYLAAGGRKIDAWYSRLRVVEVAFDEVPEAFSNINTREELREHEKGDAHNFLQEPDRDDSVR
jgi:molybdopterin-guanine dinucleotide biosynthesis protein A